MTHTTLTKYQLKADPDHIVPLLRTRLQHWSENQPQYRQQLERRAQAIRNAYADKDWDRLYVHASSVTGLLELPLEDSQQVRVITAENIWDQEGAEVAIARHWPYLQQLWQQSTDTSELRQLADQITAAYQVQNQQQFAAAIHAFTLWGTRQRVGQASLDTNVICS